MFSVTTLSCGTKAPCERSQTCVFEKDNSIQLGSTQQDTSNLRCYKEELSSAQLSSQRQLESVADRVPAVILNRNKLTHEMTHFTAWRIVSAIV